MGASGGRTAPDLTASSSASRRKKPTVEQRLFDSGSHFDFFQAVRLLQLLDPMKAPVGHAGPPKSEAARFRSIPSLTFPPSSIYTIERPTSEKPSPIVTQAFLGLIGPSGVLPRHFTELVIRLERESKSAERRALREWLDLFNHRLTSLFYRAFAKYRPAIQFEKRTAGRSEPDDIVKAVLSLVGVGMPSLRNRLKVLAPRDDAGRLSFETLARVDDLALVYYSGLLSHRPRSAAGLEAILNDFFGLPVEVHQFQGQWLALEPEVRTRVGEPTISAQLGVGAVAGDRVWDVQGKVRLRLGPLNYGQFIRLLPDPTPVPYRKGFFLLSHLTRLYVGPELDFEVQLILRADEVPECRLPEEGEAGPILGWNSWIHSLPIDADADDAVFDGRDVVLLDPEPTASDGTPG